MTKPAQKRVFRSRGVVDSGDPTLAHRFDELLAEDLGREYDEMTQESER